MIDPRFKPPHAREIVFICAGPPRCELSGDKAWRAQIAGCPWCHVTVTHDDGSKSEYKPGEA